MTGLQKLIAEYQAKKYPTRHGMYERMLELLAEEEAQKPTAPASLVEDYDAGLLNDYGGGKVGWWHDYIREVLTACNEHWREALSRYTPTESIAEEPLAVTEELSVLAGRKGKFLFQGIQVIERREAPYFFISDSKMSNELTEGKIFGTPYFARQFLNSLPDREDK